MSASRKHLLKHARGLITVREKQSLCDLYLFWRWRGIRRDSLHIGGVH